MDSSYTDPHRHYRGMCSPEQGEISFQVVLEETDLWVTGQKDLSAQILDYVQKLRLDIKSYTGINPHFLSALAPVQEKRHCPEIVARMIHASARVGVGPMASVAGCIAQMVAEEFSGQSPELMVENGGDIYMYSSRERTVGLLAEPGEGVLLGIRIPPDKFPCALCSSSSRIGHSLSLGEGDLVAVMAPDGCIADAAATALANSLRGKKGLNKMLAYAQTLQEIGISGVFGQKDEEIGAWGDMELVSLPGGQ